MQTNPAAPPNMPPNAPPYQPQSVPQNAYRPPAVNTQSYFDGGLLQLIGWRMLGGLITLVTLGICYPWALCMVYRWRINHTVIYGRRLRFTGTATGLFGQWIKWMLLCIITLGIYSLWLGIALEKWRVKHTTLA